MIKLPTSWHDLNDHRDVLVGRKQLLATVAHFAVRQSPYSCPADLHIVLQKLDVIWDAQGWSKTDFANFVSLRLLEAWLRNWLTRMPEVEAWNKRKDGSDSPFNFTSRHDGKPDPDSDFIDLDALVRNVAMEAWRESIHSALQDA